MLAEARRRLALEDEEVLRRVRLVEGTGERARETMEGETFDAVLCHGVLMYLEDPRPMIHALSTLLRPGGILSVLAKNAAALALPSKAVTTTLSHRCRLTGTVDASGW